MSQHFITNEKQLLTHVFDGILPYSDKLYFLVGYFYFSGFEEINNKLDDKSIKILVGLDIEKDIINKVKQVELISEHNFSRGQIKKNFNESFVQIFNETDFFDSPKKQEAFKVFVNKIKNGTLQIRKTLKPNHAKLYLFERLPEHNENGTYPGTLITGSSNLTTSGLRHQYELNVILRDKNDFEEGLSIFNKLWDDAVVIADKDHIEEFEIEIINKIWFDKIYKPYYFFIRVLHEYFSIDTNRNIKFPFEITKNKFFNLKYQTDAIKQALHIIETHNGVIVADVVGLGKSIIASSVAHNLGLKTIIIAPPHLVKQWDDEYRNFFDFNAKVFSSGAINKALDYIRQNFSGSEYLIIIDEAHKYRNENTQDYADLHELCQGNKVVLLTATPFNNRPQDIFSMVKLFQIPAKSTLRNVANLGDEFAKLIREYKSLSKAQKEKTLSAIEIKRNIDIIAQKIRDIIYPLVIRRSRLDLLEIDEYKKDILLQNIEFPEVEPPEILEYNLGDIESLYIQTLDYIASEDKDNSFIGARYKPVAYLKDFKKYQKKIEEVFGDFNMFKESQNNISKFMRHLLVRRFESSVFAFKKSLENMIDSSKNILNWYNIRKTVPIFKKGNIPFIENYYYNDNDNISENLNELVFDDVVSNLKSKGLFEVDANDIKVDFEKDLIKDIKLLEKIYNQWFENDINSDPKLDSFRNLLKQKIKDEPNRKIIVFSEFMDTVDYLYDNLKNDIRIFKYTSADASQKNKEIIRKNFDAGISEEFQSDDFDVLIATDAISEGYNLHRAGTVFNYDIPYNPTRVIQRVGRINRINKKVFDKLFIFNYFPSQTGETETRTKEISTLKIAMIQAILGEDTRVLTKDEELKSFFKKQFENENAINEQRSWENKYLNLYNSLKSANNEDFQKALQIPIRSRVRRTVEKEKSGVLVFGKKGKNFVFRLGNSLFEDLPISPALAISLFDAEIFEQPQIVSNSFGAVYENVKNNLFQSLAIVKVEKYRNEIIKKIDEALSNNLSTKKDYLKDLRAVVELDALPEIYLKHIGQLPAEKFDSLMNEISHRYLISILSKAAAVDDGNEILIISEELI